MKNLYLPLFGAFYGRLFVQFYQDDEGKTVLIPDLGIMEFKDWAKGRLSEYQSQYEDCPDYVPDNL